MQHHPIPPDPTILIACLGNEHRGDDAFGLLVAKRLGHGTAHVRVLAHHGDALSLIDEWRGVDHVVVVDAIAAALAPGTVVHLDVSREAAPLELGATSTHALGGGGVIEVARVLGMLPARVDVIAVAGRDFSVGARVSPEVSARVEKVVAMVHAMVSEFAASVVPHGHGESHA